MTNSKHQDLILHPQGQKDQGGPSASEGETLNSQNKLLLLDIPKLINRVNVLIDLAGYCDDAKSADLQAREIATHMKNIKEIMAHNAAILESQERTTYSRYADLPPLNLEDTIDIRAKIQGILLRYAQPPSKSESNFGNTK